MIIYEDTRQQEGKHENVRRYCEQNGISIVRQKLDCGDYMLHPDGKVTIDTKYGLQEMYACLVNDRSRFYKEVRRCYDKGIKLYLLIEQRGIHSIEDVRNWQPKYGTLSSREIAKRLYKLHIAYGVEVLFCDKRSTGRKIIEILSAENQTTIDS